MFANLAGIALASLAFVQDDNAQQPPDAPPAEEEQEPTRVSGLNPGQMFLGASRLQEAGRDADAEAIYRALMQDPDVAIRNEARFRLAALKERNDKPREAAVLLREILDEEPNAQRARLELARILAMIGEERAARRELRQAQAGGLPDNVSRIVDQFQNALRSRKPLGASLEVALAPDSNINRATDRSSLDTGFFPIELDEDAQSQSGLGLSLAGQGFARLPISKKLSLLPRLAGTGRFYESSQFNDISASGQLGLERAAGDASRLTLSAGFTRRWFGGERFNDTAALSLDWLRPLNAKSQIRIGATAGIQNFARNPGQDGELYQVNVGYERALSARSGLGFGLSGARQTATNPSFASWSGGGTALFHREAFGATVFTSASIRRLSGDAAPFLFDAPRREWLLRGVLGANIRGIQIEGFSPVVRFVAERNFSNVELFDYSRAALEVGISRAF